MREWAKGQGPRAKGNTLVELLVVVAILGIIAGVTGLTFGRVGQLPEASRGDARVAQARREAIRTGRSVTVMVPHGGALIAATAHADGQVVADTALGIDRLSGRRLP